GSALHRYIDRAGKRPKVSINAQRGEAREVHLFAALIGYGADAIHPYLTYATYKQAIEDGALPISYEVAVTKHSKSVT
ncbi:glutamate synthase central domain-containing protein, partial [Bacillus sp. GbtcB13]|uniref:glutamate synthase central domain-containing protein n=1 Tax=Bacillus sp. GbtcB13 TaxID=2824758 RepID=UPI001C302DD8